MENRHDRTVRKNRRVENVVRKILEQFSGFLIGRLKLLIVLFFCERFFIVK